MSAERPSLAPVVWVFAATKLGLHLLTAGSYGWHGDELYYQACAEHLAWGYVDHPPFSIAATALWSAIGGDGLAWTRIPAALAGTLALLGTALIARELGGRAWAQGLAALVALVAPVNLVMHGYASMNAYDAAFWTLAMWLSLRVAAKPARSTWLSLGLVMGLGLLNKWTVAWLGAGLAFGWLATRERRLLASRDPWLAVALAIVVVAPHLLWQVEQGWPTLEFLRNIAKSQLVPAGPLDLLAQQVSMMNPIATPIWLLGLVVLLLDGKRPGARALGLCFLVVAVILLSNRATKPYYLSLAQPPLVAAGAVWLATKAESFRGGRLALGAFAALIFVMGLILLPLVVRLFPPAALVEYQAEVAPRGEGQGRLEEHFSILFGWPELVDAVAEVHRALPPAERAAAVVLTPTYAEAAAIDHFGRERRLPPAISGHNTYWHWGPPDEEPAVVIIIGGYGLRREDFEAGWTRVEETGRSHCEWCDPIRADRPLWVAREPKLPLREMWPTFRRYD